MIMAKMWSSLEGLDPTTAAAQAAAAATASLVRPPASVPATTPGPRSSRGSTARYSGGGQQRAAPRTSSFRTPSAGQPSRSISWGQDMTKQF